MRIIGGIAIDQRGNDGRRRAEPEQQQYGHQIGEHRYRLHQVQHRHGASVEPTPAPSRDAEQQTEGCAERHRNRIDASVIIALFHCPNTQ
jgi:hypothetical protein